MAGKPGYRGPAVLTVAKRDQLAATKRLFGKF
jgi:hypothetical protein